MILLRMYGVVKMNKIIYDNPRKNEMTAFLRYLYDIKKSNPELYINKSMVYHELCRSGLEEKEMGPDRELIDNRNLFDTWFNRYRGANDVFAYCDPNWNYFFQFRRWNDEENKDEFIKLYIPIKKNSLYNGVNQIIDFIRSLGVQHCSKVSSKIRSDNFIVRLKKGDYDTAYKIINFIKTNAYLQDGLNETNPFVPTVDGIGIMEETGISYNSEMANLISNYIDDCYKKGVTNVDINSFSAWMKDNCYDLEVREVFNNAIGETREEKKELSVEQKIGLIIDSLVATFHKYDSVQAEAALRNALKGDYSYFTNGTENSIKYRDLLRKSVSPETIKNVVYGTLERVMGFDARTMDIDTAAAEYCDFLFSSSLSRRLEDISNVTIEKGGIAQCVFAIKRYLNENDPKGFSRFKKSDIEMSHNYRDDLSIFNKNRLVLSMQRSLQIRGINPSGLSIDELITTYSNELGKAMIPDEEIGQQMSRR